MDNSEVKICDFNATNMTLPAGFYDLAETYKVAAGAVIFLGTTPFVLLEFRLFPLGTTFAVMFGAFLMVVFQIVTQEEVYEVIGQQGPLSAIFLILGILIFVQYFEREQLLLKILRKLLQPAMRFEFYLIRIIVLSFLLSVFFTGDMCCAVLTPLLLKVWESHERPMIELETIVLAVASTSNIASMVTIISSLQMAVISGRTSKWEYEGSRIDMTVCIMYLLPVAALSSIINTCFLLLHYKMKTSSIEQNKLVSETSQSEQEMAGLTAGGNGHLSIINNGLNGYLRTPTQDDTGLYEGIYMGPAAHRSDDHISIPCHLETIPEDEILEISGSQSASLRDCYEIESPSPIRTPERGEACALDYDTSSTDSDENDECMRNTAENLHQLNIDYRPSALQSQNLCLAVDSCPSLTQSLEQHGLVLSPRLGIYRSLRAFSTMDFIPLSSGADASSSGAGGTEGIAGPADSVTFPVTLCVLSLAVIGLLLAGCYTVKFDLGLVPMGVALFAVIMDCILNRRPASHLLQRADWSIVLLLMGLFVWVQGFHNTHLINYTWSLLGLQASSYNAANPQTIAALSLLLNTISFIANPQTIAALSLLVLTGLHFLGSIPTILIVLNLLEPCGQQQGVVLYLAVLCTVGGNISLFASTANLIVVQRGIQAIKYRLPFRTHLQFGFPTSVINLIIGILLVYGLLQIDVR